jgi:hypothetical protein
MPDTPPFLVRFRGPAHGDAATSDASDPELEGAPYRGAIGAATFVDEDRRPIVYRQALAFAARTRSLV